jgi:hypothetical protein
MRMNKSIFISIILFVLFLSGCISSQAPKLSPQQLRTLQTHTYQGVDKRSLVQATITTLQDLGYSITSSDYESGIISAIATPGNGGRMLSASITSHNNGDSSVRINIDTLFATTISGPGFVRYQNPTITDPIVYQNIFDQIQHNLFIDSGGTIG